MGFSVRKVDQVGASFGQKLRALRHDRGFNIEQMAVATHIHERIITAFEADDFAHLPEPIYSRQFLRGYVRYLGGDEKYFLQCFEDAQGTCDLVNPMLLPREKVRRARFLVTPRIFRFAGLGVIGCLILVYLGFQVRRILIPPVIEITSPADGVTTDSAIVAVAGQVFEQAEVSINGQKVLLNKDGTFIANIDLERGLNLITVEAKKRYSQTSTVLRRVVLDRNGQSVSLGTIKLDP